MSPVKTVVVVGQGYVGLPLSMAAVAAGLEVVGIDTNRALVESIKNVRSHTSDVSDLELREAFLTGRYRVSDSFSEVGGFEVAVITVPTPLKRGLPDVSYIESAARDVGALLQRDALVVLESTTYPGTTEEVVLPILERESEMVAGVDFRLGYSPERIDPGNRKWNFFNTTKVVSGIDEPSLEAVTLFYQSLGVVTHSVSGTREAEMSKLLENTFRHVNIALINELSMAARGLGVDIWEAIEAASSKPFGFMRFEPGPGVGGHCLPVDPSYLSWAVENTSGKPFRFVELANQINEFMPQYVVGRAAEILEKSGNSLSTAHVAILGLAYKPNSNDMRESPSLKVWELLRAQGAEISAVDDLIDDTLWPAGLRRARPHTDEEFDLALILTPHDDGQFGWVLDRAHSFLDARNFLGLDAESRL